MGGISRTHAEGGVIYTGQHAGHELFGYRIEVDPRMVEPRRLMGLEP